MGFDNILALLGGLGAFLFGMKYMGDGLELCAGPKMNRLLETLTRNPFFGFLLGTFVTAVIQSSSATTVMVMGFLNAGMMQLSQATGIIIGANIGTTMTSILIALDASGIAPACIFVGAAFVLFSKKNHSKHIGQVILGFGILFQGLHSMSDAMKVLKDVPEFQDFIMNSKNPVLGLVVGTIMCAIIQSSSASVGILQALAMQGLMPMYFAGFLICGINIGSSMPPFLSAINAKSNAKRAAFIYFFYNLFGAVLFFLITLITPFTAWIEATIPDPVFQVSLYHIIFKVVTALILLPFTNVIVNISYKVIPVRSHDNNFRFLYIDKHLVGSPSITVKQIEKELERMAQLVRDNFVMASEGLLGLQKIDVEVMKNKEDIIDYLNHKITEFLVQFSAVDMPSEIHKSIADMFRTVIDLERIGDHAIDLMFKEKTCRENGYVYSEQAQKDIQYIYEKTLQIYDDILKAYMRKNLEDIEAKRLHHSVEELLLFSQKAEDCHIERLRNHQCNPDTGIVFAEALRNYERISQHADHLIASTTKTNTILL